MSSSDKRRMIEGGQGAWRIVGRVGTLLLEGSSDYDGHSEGYVHLHGSNVRASLDKGCTICDFGCFKGWCVKGVWTMMVMLRKMMLLMLVDGMGGGGKCCSAGEERSTPWGPLKSNKNAQTLER